MIADEGKFRDEVLLYFPTPAGRFILEHGQWFTPAPRPQGVRQGRAKNCYRNAVQFVMKEDGYCYGEGFAWSSTSGIELLVQHAWPVDGDGHALELTWKQPGLRYFGLSMSPVLMAAALHENGIFGLFHNAFIPSAVERAFTQ